MAEPAYKVIVTPRAEASLERIIDYIAEDASYQTALKVRDAIEKAAGGMAVVWYTWDRCISDVSTSCSA